MINITIIGTGNIANALARAMQAESCAQLYGVAGSCMEKAKEFAEKYSIPNAYGSVEEALADDGTDLVYIALPHGLHYEMTKKALLSGRNVLCEKPIAINARQAKELFDLAAEKKLFLSEAMWTRFLPSVEIVKKLLADKVIGETKFLSVTIGGDARGIKRMTDSLLAGGMLLDSGIYAVTTMALLFGSEITDIVTSAVMSDEGVDLRSTTAVTFADGKTAVLNMSMDSFYDDKIMIAGDRGRIEMNVPFNWRNICIYRGGTAEAVEIPPQACGGYEYEVKAVCKAIQEKKTFCEETAPGKTLFVMEFMDKLREKWGLKYPTME